MDENWSLNSACGHWTGVDAGCSVCSMSRLRSDRCLGSGKWCLRWQWLLQEVFVCEGNSWVDGKGLVVRDLALFFHIHKPDWSCFFHPALM